MDLIKLRAQMLKPDAEAMARARERWDSIAKPVGSLGELENLVVRIAGIQRTERVSIEKRCVLVLCGDNGVVKQGVASTPPEITATMASFIAQKRSSVCIMANAANAEVFPVDVGMFRRVEEPNLSDRHVADGTGDISMGPAMTKEQAMQAIQTGIDLAREKKAQGYQLLCTGEMGIGNTTTSTAMAAVFLGKSVEALTGRGAGLDDAGLERKRDAIRRAIAVNQPDPADGLDVLSKLGGFDIAAMCGVFLGGALYGIPVVIDGYISAVAALTAVRLCPEAGSCMLPSHVSAEPADTLVLDVLGLRPVLHGGMRLGEGTGAVAVLPVLDMAIRVYRELMTFADIGM